MNIIGNEHQSVIRDFLLSAALAANAPQSLSKLLCGTCLENDEVFRLLAGKINADINSRRSNGKLALKSTSLGISIHVAMQLPNLLVAETLDKSLCQNSRFIYTVENEYAAACRIPFEKSQNPAKLIF